MRDVEAAEGEHVLVLGPLAFDQFHLQPFFFEKSFLNRREDRRLAREADVTDANLVRIGISPLLAASKKQQRRYQEQGQRMLLQVINVPPASQFFHFFKLGVTPLTPRFSGVYQLTSAPNRFSGLRPSRNR